MELVSYLIWRKKNSRALRFVWRSSS